MHYSTTWGFFSEGAICFRLYAQLKSRHMEPVFNCVKFQQVEIHALPLAKQVISGSSYGDSAIEGIQAWCPPICKVLWFACYIGVLHNRMTLYFKLRYFPLQHAFLLRRLGSTPSWTTPETSFANGRWANQCQLSHIFHNVNFLSWTCLSLCRHKRCS